MIRYHEYTEEELELIRRALVEQNEKAQALAKERGYKIHPRIEAAKLK